MFRKLLATYNIGLTLKVSLNAVNLRVCMTPEIFQSVFEMVHVIKHMTHVLNKLRNISRMKINYESYETS